MASIKEMTRHDRRYKAQTEYKLIIFLYFTNNSKNINNININNIDNSFIDITTDLRSKSSGNRGS